MTKSWLFEWMYLLGRSPWDTEITPPEVVELIGGGELPPGRALDLGCGTGTNTIYLARHGWEAVGVDFAMLAIWRARRKAGRAGLECRFYRADVTDLSFLANRFDLVLDIGCLHSLSQEARLRYAAEVTRLVRPGGLYMLYAFTPRHKAGPRGVSPDEVRRLFTPPFVVVRQKGGEDPTGPASAWHWLRSKRPSD